MAEITPQPPVPFVIRLRSICQHIDKNVALLKLDLSRPSGSTPFTYDRGLNAIKSDISKLKQKCDELKPAIESINNFSNWLHSMQDLVNQQTQDVKKMEEYLIKFGYNPVPNPATEIPITSVPKVETVGKMSASENGTAERAMQDSLNIKVNLLPTNQNNKESEVPIMPATASKLVKEMHYMDTAEYKKTPLSSRTKVNYLQQSAGRGSCYRPGHSTVVEEWLKGIENCMLELTPDVLRHKRAPVKQEQRDKTESIPTKIKLVELTPDVLRQKRAPVKREQSDKTESIPMKIKLPDMNAKPEISEENLSLMKMPGTPAQNSQSIANAASYANTPVEPELSEYTIQCLNLKKFLSVKENAVPSDTSNMCTSQNGNVEGSLVFKENCNQRKSTLLYGANKSYSHLNMKNCTPEEPILSYQALATVASHIETKTPEEPVLSSATIDLLHSQQLDLGALKEPVLSWDLSKYSATNELDTKTPEEPVLVSQDIRSGTTTFVDPKTPEEPVLSCLDIKTDTPEEPVLSCLDIKTDTPEKPVLSCLDIKTDTPEEPVLTNQIIPNKSYDSVFSHTSSVHTSRNVQSHLMYDDDMPKSPQLSEITLSLLSATNQGYPYSKYKSLFTEKNVKPDSLNIHSRNDAHLLGRNGRDASHRAQPSHVVDKASKENVSLPADVSSKEKKNWHHPGIPYEKFAGVGDDDDIPPSPQLSDTTLRLLAGLY